MKGQPELGGDLPVLIDEAYKIGAEEAVSGLRKYRESGRRHTVSPVTFTPDEVLDPNFWPEPRHRS